QAEDGIRDRNVTGVQTCALPISSWRPWAAVAIFLVIGMAATLFYGAARGNRARLWHRINRDALDHAREAISAAKSAHRSVEAERSEERRVGKECRRRGAQSRART